MPTPPREKPKSWEDRRAISRTDVLEDPGGPGNQGAHPLFIAFLLFGALAALGAVSVFALRDAIREYPQVFIVGGVLVALAVGSVVLHNMRVKSRLAETLRELEKEDRAGY